MAVQTVSNVYIRSFRDGAPYVPSGGEWADANNGGVYYLGYGYLGSTMNCVVELKFTLESEAEIIQLSLQNYTYVSDNRKFNYIILPEENENYNNATYDMEADGVVRLTQSAYEKTVLMLSTKLSAGTYYMYLWTSMSTETTCWVQLQGTTTMQYGLPSDFDLSLAVKWLGDGGVYADWYALNDSGLHVMAGYSGGHNYVTILRFILPKPVRSIDLSACLYKEGTWGDGEVKYKIVSGAEDYSLDNANADIEADGVYALTHYNDWERFGFTIDKVIPAGITYLYIWTNKAVGVSNVIGFRLSGPNNNYSTIITYEELNGLVYIDDGVEFRGYQVYIDNGTGWDMYTPYIDNGTSWDLYS